MFCTGPSQEREIRQMEELDDTPRKNLVEVGYPLLDEMLEAYESKAVKVNETKQILIAPSWQKDNIVDSCLEKLLDSLGGRGFNVVVRPHPQHVRHKKAYMEQLKARYAGRDDIEIQTDFSSNSTVFDSDLLITDWSDISWEFAFTTKKPVLFINTPMKVMNPDWQKIAEVPLNIALRDVIGRSLEVDEIDKAGDTVLEMLGQQEQYREQIDRAMHEYVYNIGSSTRVGAKYIIGAIQKKAQQRKENK